MLTMMPSNMIPTDRESVIILNELRARVGPAPAPAHPAAPGTVENPLIWPEEGEPVRDSIPNFFSKAFPYLFPTGMADLNMTRHSCVPVKEWLWHLLRYKDQRFATDHRWVYFLISSICTFTIDTFFEQLNKYLFYSFKVSFLFIFEFLIFYLFILIIIYLFLFIYIYFLHED